MNKFREIASGFRCPASPALSVLVWLAMVAMVQATSIGFTFGRLQGPADNQSAGPVVSQTHWNNVNARCLANGIDYPWSNTPDMMFPNAANRGSNTFGDQNGLATFTGTLIDQMRLDQRDSSGAAVAIPITITITDPGQQSAWRNNGAYGGGRDAGTLSPTNAIYDQGYLQWGTAGNENHGDSTVSFNNIPFGRYDVYVAGTLLTHDGTTISTAGAVFTNLTSAAFEFTAPWNTPYVGYPGCLSISYIQFVEPVSAEGLLMVLR